MTYEDYTVCAVCQLPMVQIIGSVQMTHEDYKSKTVCQWHQANTRVFKTANISNIQHQKHCQITT
jgi:hypothetical protein